MARSVTQMSLEERLAEVLKRSKKSFGPDVGQVIDSLLSPLNLSVIAGTLVVWAGSHFFGVGEIVDVLLLVVGAFAIGWSIKQVAGDLYTFADRTLRATCDGDLDLAASAISRAIVVAGVTVIMGILLRRSVKQIQATRGTTIGQAMTPRSPGLVRVGVDPQAGQLWSRPGIVGDPTLAAGEGSTSAFGEVRLSTAGSASDQALVRAHELVHRLLTPRFGLLRTFRIRLAMSAYLRSALLQYLEEVIAETVAQLRVNGTSGVLRGIKFPVVNGYMAVGELASDGAAIGTVTAGTRIWTAQFKPSLVTHGVENVCR